MAIAFKRNLSPFLLSFFQSRADLNSRNYNTHIAIVITLQDSSELQYATGTITIDTISKDGASVGITPITFVAKLSGAPDIRQTQTKAPDISEIEIVNLDYLLTQGITGATRIYDNAKVRIYWAFPKTTNYEGLIYFDGLLSNIIGDDESARLGIIADVSSKTSLVGAEITQRCLNELGDSWCGVGNLPVGATCSKVWRDKVNGCAYWGGVYQGLPQMNPDVASPAGIYGGGTGTSGDDDDTNFPHIGTCPDLKTTLFPSANGGVIHAKDMRQGEVILTDDDIPVTVVDCEPVFAGQRFLVRTVYGASLIVSDTHHFLRSSDDKTGLAVSNWKFDEDDLVVKIPNEICLARHTVFPKLSPEYSFTVAEAGDVLRLTVSEPHSYWAGMEEGFYLGNHNKPIYGGIYYPMYQVA